jgi:hypothetical protein
MRPGACNAGVYGTDANGQRLVYCRVDSLHPVTKVLEPQSLKVLENGFVSSFYEQAILRDLNLSFSFENL